MSTRWLVERKEILLELGTMVDELFAVGKNFEKALAYTISIREGSEAVNLETHVSTQKILSRLETVGQEVHTLIAKKQAKTETVFNKTARVPQAIKDELENTIVVVGTLIQDFTNSLDDNCNPEIIERLDAVVYPFKWLSSELFPKYGPASVQPNTSTSAAKNGDGFTSPSVATFIIILLIVLPSIFSILMHPALGIMYACFRQIPLLILVSLVHKLLDWPLELSRWGSIFGACYLVANRHSRVYKIFSGLKKYVVLDAPAPAKADDHPKVIIGNVLWTVAYFAVSVYLSDTWYEYGGRLSFPLIILASVMRGFAYIGIRTGVLVLLFFILGRRKTFRLLSPLFRIAGDLTQFQIKPIWNFALELSSWLADNIAIFKSLVIDLLCYFFDGQDAVESSQENYCYEPLDVLTDEIRLLRVSKRYPWSKPVIKLCEHLLEKAPRYDAISYTWDNQEMDQSLQLHKGIIRTTKNVVHIVSKRASWMQARYLWIDAICIDQSNIPEKQSQIRKMRDIYTSAKRTIAWISYEPIPFYDMWLLSLSNETSRSSIRTTLVQLIAVVNDSAVHTIQHIIEKKKKFLSQKYWSRGWIVQEFALAHEVHIMYGGHFLSLDDLRSFLLPQPLVTSIELTGPLIKECKNGTEIKLYMNKDGAPINVVKEPQSTIQTLLFARDLISVKKYASLSTVLSISTHFDTFSPHDKVYSVLGMLEAEWYKLQPDYTIPIDDLYLKVAQILSDKSWDSVLQFAGLGFPRKINTLPR
jgi:hypothetical protein